jgi:predicted RNA-binding protein Jag
MKSITEQGSSIAKAIEKGWEKAGKPQEFSVKIFEEAKWNFLGITTNPAKVGIFFELPHPVAVSQKETPRARGYSKPHRPSSAGAQHHGQKKEHRQQQPASEQSHQTKSYHQQQQQHQEPVQHNVESGAQQKEIWNEAMLSMAKEWLRSILDSMNFSHITFYAEANNYDLKLTFERPPFAETDRQQQFYRGLSLLLMQTLRHKLRRSLRGFRVIITNS